MNRLHPKPDIQETLKFINNENIARQQSLLHTKKKIMVVLEKNPQGIDIEKFSMKFEEEFGEWLLPSELGFSDIVEMLRSLNDIVDLKLMESNDQVLLFPMSSKNSDENKKSMNITAMREEVIDTFRSIISSLGGLSVDVLIQEYEARTNQKLNIQKLAFDSFPDFLSHLSGVFKTCKRKGQVIFLDSANPNIGPPQEQEHTNTPSEGMNSSFGVKTTMNLKKLLEEEFPFGLQLNELYAAYEVFYGSSREDLDYEKHGYRSLEDFLAANSGVMSLHHHYGDICVLPCQSLQYPKPEQINLSYAGGVVGGRETYSLVDKLPSGKVQVVVGEVYTPKLFWVIKYGEYYLQLLDELMDRMLKFYSSPLGNRYKLLDRKVAEHMAVAALHPLDMNFYRAFVLSMEDLTTVKVFFVDYGTVWITSVDYLRLLHKSFFTLPAQAIKCSLHGILPATGKRTWSRACSGRLLNLVQNKRLVAEVISKEMTTVIKLWDISHGKNLNIGDVLVREGLAVPLSSPDHLDNINHTPKPVASSIMVGVEIDRGLHIGSTSFSLNPEEVTPQQEGAMAQNPVPHLEVASGQVEHLDVYTGNSTPTQENESQEDLSSTISTASSSDITVIECTQIVRCSSDPDIEITAAGNQSCMSSALSEKEAVTVRCSLSPADEIFISDDELQQDDDKELSDCYLIEPIELSFIKKVHVIQIDGIKYVLNIEIPFMNNNEVHYYGIILRKEINQNIYSLLIESGCDIFEPNGDVKDILALCPLSHLPTVLSQHGCSIATNHSGTEIVQEWSHEHNFPGMFREEKDFELTSDTSHRSSASGSPSTKTFYRHGAQVEPLRRPHYFKELLHWCHVLKVMQAIHQE